MSTAIAMKRPNTNQMEMDLDLGIAHGRPVLRVDEVARGLALSENTVRNLLETGVFVTCPKGVGEERLHVTIERWSVAAWRLNNMEDQGIDVAQFRQDDKVRFWRGALRNRQVRIQKVA